MTLKNVRLPIRGLSNFSLFLAVICIVGFHHKNVNAVHEIIASDAQKSINTQNEENSSPVTHYTREDERYQLLQKITYGKATLNEVRRALSDTNDVAYLASAIHALYSMRWHRGVNIILNDLWLLNKNKHSDLAWEFLEKIPVRIALASTINRIRISNTQEFKQYIRNHKYDEHEFHRAQVVISLALNGDPVDVPYIKEMADTDNVYVGQSAITSLAIMGIPQAREALVELAKKYTDNDKGRLIREVMLRAYPPK